MDLTDRESEEYQELIEALKQWAKTHPMADRPIISRMAEDGPAGFESGGRGDHVTPEGFLEEVMEGKQYGVQFLRFLEKASRSHERRPADFIWMAVRANENHRTKL